MRKRLFNKLGMTYIELLVALALLSLIIVSFTPMLMSSYENLYKAGERVETVYKSQEEMEEVRPAARRFAFDDDADFESEIKIPDFLTRKKF